MSLQPNTPVTLNPAGLAELAVAIKNWGRELGFQHVGITGTDLTQAESRLSAWLARDHHGEMAWMAIHGSRRSRPAELVPGTVRVISVRMDYLPEASAAEEVLANPTLAYVSRYALGRDYHKVMRRRLQVLAERIANVSGSSGYRAFVDSAPVLEKPLARNAGLGWVGKHSNLLDRDAGSWFFLGELYTDIPLPVDPPVTEHCGDCEACITACPTAAIVEPYIVDARRCISYLTIELKGSIPLELRPLLGNRIYGCDDCQLVCPWNRFAKVSPETDYAPRHGLDAARLITLFDWDEATFLHNLQGSPIRRIGHESWLRNIAVALGNAPNSPEIIAALLRRLLHPSAVVREHVEWALQQHGLNPEEQKHHV